MMDMDMVNNIFTLKGNRKKLLLLTLVCFAALC